MLRKFRIKTRLLISFFIVVLFTLIVGLTGYARLTSLGTSALRTIQNVSIMNDVYDYNVAVDADLFNLLYISDTTLTHYLLQITREQTEGFLEYLNKYLEFQDQFSDVFTPGEMQTMANLLEMYEETYIPVVNDIFVLIEQGRREEALSVYINRFSPIFNTFTYYINEVFMKNLDYSLSETERNNESASINAYIMLALVLLSLIVSIILALTVTKSIAVPLSGLETAAEKIAHGELDVQFEISQSNDEIAHLSQRLDETLQQLNQAQQLKLEAIEAQLEKEKAEAASKSKSAFLASMSHEIRTPMNAIIGMAELLLRKNLSDESRADVLDIKQAGANLLSIINDILDFSKIEAGKLEIIPVNYLLSSLINDTVNIIRMRLTEKPIRFYTNIDGQIPNSLIGDEVRLRQILLNLLSNAVKYSEKGHISLAITVEKRVDDQVWLKAAVSDTGKGIKPEDQAILFGEFAQVDKEKNRGIEGTGLGLAITKQLCLAMGGDINVKSKYGSGSVFTAIIPQGIESEAPFAVVEEPGQKKVLIYEGRAVYAKSVAWSLENMKVPHTLVTNLNDFANALLSVEWFYVFSGYGLYKRIKPVMDRTESSFPGRKKPPLALMVEFGSEAYIPNVRFVSLPVQALSIANVLNGKTDSHGIAMPGGYDGSGAGGMVRFTFPKARLLVVDDIATNLKVAEGLLAPYQAVVDTCTSGKEAIELVKRMDYDIVFMDHLMPEMDGIETTALIREWEQMKNEEAKTNEQKANGNGQVPIIALTASAVVGMREMFIEKGFNDFLAKPIDVSKLDEALNRWIPREKRDQGENKKEKIKGKREQGRNNMELGIRTEDYPSLVPNSSFLTPQFLEIPGVDVQRGIAMTGNKIELYKKVLAMFCKDVEKRLPLLQTVPEADALPAFVTQVHALKSASASIGAAGASALAAGLEAAGKAGDLAFIGEKVKLLAETLAELIGRIDAALKTDTAMAHNNIPVKGSFASLLRELDTALQSQKAEDIDRVLEELMRQPLDTDKKAALEQISDEVLMAEFSKAGEILAGLLRGA